MLSWSLSPALIPPSNGSTRYSSASSPRRRRTSSPADSSAFGEDGPMPKSSLSRAMPSADNKPGVSSAVAGIPNTFGGRGYSVASRTMRGDPAAGLTSSPSSPSEIASSVISGRRARKLSGAVGSVLPSSSTSAIFPPRTSPASNRCTSAPRRAASSAAEIPVMPPPIIATLLVTVDRRARARRPSRAPRDRHGA